VCLAIPGRIVARDAGGGDLATVDVVGVTRTVNVALLEPEGVQPGDWVLIHVGFAMAKLDDAEARATLAALESIGQVWADEVDALRGSGGPGG